jgi:hypothetical protein
MWDCCLLPLSLGVDMRICYVVICSLNRCETGTFVHTGVCFLFFVCFCLPLFGSFLWLPDEELTLLFLLHRENRDFSILMKDIVICSTIGRGCFSCYWTSR